MLSKRLVFMILHALVLMSVPASAAASETEMLIIRDATGTIPSEQFGAFARTVDLTLEKVLQFWAADPRISQLGKITVEIDHSLSGTNTSVFSWKKEGGQQKRVVRVFGSPERPHLLAHKLTSAVYPNQDKLIRNMMGEVSESRFGNPLSFPMCGYGKDYWVFALLQAGLYIPLKRIGPEHSDWGMEIQNSIPSVKDRAKQHASYIEAGSLGEFLVDTYGTEPVKRFNRMSRNSPRPWKEAFGVTQEELEEKWIEAVRSRASEREDIVSAILKLLKSPDTACSRAQASAKEK